MITWPVLGEVGGRLAQFLSCLLYAVILVMKATAAPVVSTMCSVFNSALSSLPRSLMITRVPLGALTVAQFTARSKMWEVLRLTTVCIRIFYVHRLGGDIKLQSRCDRICLSRTFIDLLGIWVVDASLRDTSLRSKRPWISFTTIGCHESYSGNIFKGVSEACIVTCGTFLSKGGNSGMQRELLTKLNIVGNAG